MDKYVQWVFIPQRKGVVYPQRVTLRNWLLCLFLFIGFLELFFKKNSRSILKSRKGHLKKRNQKEKKRMRKERKHAHKWAWPNHPVRPTGKFKWKLSFCRSPNQEVTDAPLACNNGAGVPSWSDVMALVFYFIFFKFEPKKSWSKIKKSEISSALAFL